MTVRITVSSEDTSRVVALHGLVDADLADVVADGLLTLDDGQATVVVDLRDAVLASPRALTRFLDGLSRQTAASRIAVVCDRLSGRRLLRALGPLPSTQIFTDLGQALAHVSSGRRRDEVQPAAPR